MTITLSAGNSGVDANADGAIDVGSIGSPATTVATGVTGQTYTNTGLQSGQLYYYVVSATGSGGESANSNEAAGTPR